MLVGGSGVDVDGAGADGSEGRRVAVILCGDSQRLAILQRDGEGVRGDGWTHGTRARRLLGRQSR